MTSIIPRFLHNYESPTLSPPPPSPPQVPRRPPRLLSHLENLFRQIISEYQGGFQVRSQACWLPAFFPTEKEKDEGFFFIWILIEKYSQKPSEDTIPCEFPPDPRFQTYLTGTNRTN